MEFGIFRLRFFQDRNVRVGVFPKGKEILVGGARLCCITLRSIGTGQANVRQRVDGIYSTQGAMVENLLELGNCLLSLATAKINQAAHVNGGEISTRFPYRSGWLAAKLGALLRHSPYWIAEVLPSRGSNTVDLKVSRVAALEHIDEAKVLRRLRQHGSEHARDNVAKRDAGTKITSASVLGAKRDNSGKLSNSQAVLSSPQLPDCAPATGCGLRWENLALPTPTLRPR